MSNLGLIHSVIRLFGPCTNMTRSERWQHTAKLASDLDPPRIMKTFPELTHKNIWKGKIQPEEHITVIWGLLYTALSWTWEAEGTREHLTLILNPSPRSDRGRFLFSDPSVDLDWGLSIAQWSEIVLAISRCMTRKRTEGGVSLALYYELSLDYW